MSLLVTVAYDRVLTVAKREIEEEARRMNRDPEQLWNRLMETGMLRDYAIDNLAWSELVDPSNAHLVKDEFPKQATFEIEQPSGRGRVRSNCKNCGAPNKGLATCSFCGTFGLYEEG